MGGIVMTVHIHTDGTRSTLLSRWILVPVSTCFLESERGFLALYSSDYFEKRASKLIAHTRIHTVLDSLQENSCSTSGNNVSTWAYVAGFAIAGVGVARLTADKKGSVKHFINDTDHWNA